MSPCIIVIVLTSIMTHHGVTPSIGVLNGGALRLIRDCESKVRAQGPHLVLWQLL